jgi:uncharacterized lipoprotein YmbA
LKAGRRALFGFFLTVLVLGCLGRSPTTEFYSLWAVSAESSPAAAEGGVAVGVGPARLPGYLDRPQIVRRSGQSGIGYDEFQRWASGLDAELLRVVGANLATLLPTKHLVVYPAQAPFPLDYRVILDVERFEAGPEDVVTLRARWTIVSPEDGKALAVARTDVDQQASSGSPKDLVAAHSAAADRLSRDIAERLRQLAAGAS